MTSQMTYHNPVLLQACIAGLNIHPDGIYVDVTFGGGGHSREVLKRLGPKGKLFAFDTDPDALKNKIEDERFTLIPENFRYIKRFLKLNEIVKVDGILADLGVSSHQFDIAERGFSTRFEGKLDMRMNPYSILTAQEVVNQYSTEDLVKILKQYGELKQAKQIAFLIAEARSHTPIETTENLKEVLKKALPRGKENKVLAQVFQAIRIEVNQELDVLKEFLLQTEDIIVENGRLVVISYHSLEDRLVKRYIRNGMFEGEPERDIYGNFYVPFFKVGNLIVPNQQEVISNPRARSAKLRIAKRNKTKSKS
jgi:16S rRNA (cytosine1402-N4)-methyltransferase